ncbi:hypothetical protein FOCC_FOCC008702 [Frankliniella occidentalis]|nr:hypothetical protein FOCC_FOCC008702 [Frankliniella occidentalis]
MRQRAQRQLRPVSFRSRQSQDRPPAKICRPPRAPSSPAWRRSCAPSGPTSSPTTRPPWTCPSPPSRTWSTPGGSSARRTRSRRAPCRSSRTSFTSAARSLPTAWTTPFCCGSSARAPSTWTAPTA